MNRLEYKYTLPKRIEDNIMLCFFKLAVQAGLTVFNLIDGLVDEFEDETGVDTGASTNESYDTVNDLYAPLTVETATQLQTINDLSSSMNTTELRFAQGFKVANANIITKFSCFLAKESTETGILTGYVYSDDGTGKPNAVLATFSNIDVSTITGSPTYTVYDFTGSFTPVANTQYHIVLIWTTATGTSVRLQINTSGGYSDGTASRWNGSAWIAFEWDLYFKVWQNVPQNITLLSNAVTAEAAPVKSRVVLFEEDVDAVTVNTDVKAYVSRDGGTTWTQHTLSDEGDYETGKRILSSAAVAISAQPAGTSMKWKVETLNNKNLKLHAVGVNWD